MSNEIEKQKPQAVALTEERARRLDNLAIAGKQQRSIIIGQQLKFVKGEWMAGEDKKSVLPEGKKLVYNADSTAQGWQFWEDGLVTDADMGAAIDGFQPKLRAELSLPNPEDWPVDENTRVRKDPWAKSIIALFKEPGKRGQVYTLTVGSKGGIAAMKALMKETSEGMRMRGEMFPVVVLGADTYFNKKFKTDVDIPTFTICGWVPISDFNVPLISKTDEVEYEFEAEVEAETKAEAPKAKAPKAKAKAKAPKASPKPAGKKAGGNGKGREISYE